jgi:inositol hexakisphosphate
VIHRLSNRFRAGHPSPPKGLNRSSRSTNEADSPSPKDKAELALRNLKTEAPHTQKAPKPGLFPMIGAAVLLGLTGLGLVQGAANPAPPAAPAETALVTATQTQTQDSATDLLTPMEVSSEMQVASRQGNLLGSGKILKFDQYPTLRNEDLPEQIPGAPNFRQVEDTNVHGVAQPTVDGLRNVLDRLDGKNETVVWTNMREEPVVYINGRSFSLRELAHPFENASGFEGTSGEQVERTEEQLKAEVLAEVRSNGGRMLIHDEVGDDVVGRWVEVKPENVQTTREVFDSLGKEYKIDYARVPVTDEKTPQAEDLQALTERVSQSEDGASLVFNCHAGRGRTTTAMVAAQLVQRAQHPEVAEKRFVKLDSVRQDIKEQGHYEAGNYRLILRLVNSLDNGVATKFETDQIVNLTEDMQNLRTDINRYREKSLSSDKPSSAQRAEQKGLDYLHRYHTLITFNQYAKEQAPKGFELTFDQWLDQHPELTKMLESFELAMTTPTSVPGQVLAGQDVRMA